MQAQELNKQDADWLMEHADTLLEEWSWPADVVKMASHFRKSLSPRQTSLLCELFELRHRATAKFSRADAMFFHRRGFEQSTDERIAGYKAERFRGAKRIIDLCSGIGGDAISLAQVGDAVTVLDSSEACVAFSQANVRVYETGTVAGCVQDVRHVDLHPYSHWHLDPDRRPQERRRSQPEQCEPPLHEFLGLAGRSDCGAIKLSPAANATDLLDTDVELEWIGQRGECQQQVAWFGDLARHPGQRTATWIDNTGATDTLREAPDADVDVASDAGRFLVEPRPSVLAAGLEESLAVQMQLQRLTTHASYFTTDTIVPSRLASTFEVLDDFAYHRRSLMVYLQRRGARISEIKKRNVDLDPVKLKRTLKCTKGREDVVLVFYPRGASVRVAVTRPWSVEDQRDVTGT